MNRLLHRPGLSCRFVLRVSALSLGLLLPTVLQAGLLVAPDPDWTEGEVELPTTFEPGRLRAISVRGRPGTEYLVDESSVSVGEDRVVRYVLVVRSAGGAENRTYEGIRCATGEVRLYASGRHDGSWAALKNSAWQPIGAQGYNRPRAALAYDHLCDGPAAPRDRAQALRMLRQPRHDPLNPMGVQ